MSPVSRATARNTGDNRKCSRYGVSNASRSYAYSIDADAVMNDVDPAVLRDAVELEKHLRRQRGTSAQWQESLKFSTKPSVTISKNNEKINVSVRNKSNLADLINLLS